MNTTLLLHRMAVIIFWFLTMLYFFKFEVLNTHYILLEIYISLNFNKSYPSATSNIS